MTKEPFEIYGEVVAELTTAGAPFAITEIELHGEPARVYASAPNSLLDIFAETEAKFAERDALEFEGRRYTYRELFDQAARLAAAMRARNVQPGDRIGLAMRNRPEWFVGFIAVQRVGAVATLLNSRAAAHEVAGAADKVGCSLIFADERCAERLTQGGCRGAIIERDEMAAWIAATEPDTLPVRVGADAPAAILFTSGTTGRSKGATLTHRNLCNMAWTLRFYAAAGLRYSARQLGVSPDVLMARASIPSQLMILPLFHISGVTNFIMGSQSGGLMTLMGRWDPEEALRLIEKNKVSAVAGPSLVIADLLDQPGGAVRLKSLQSAVVAGQATPPSLRERVARELPHVSTGGGWGMTEVCGVCVGAPASLLKTFTGTSGTPLPITEVRVAGPDGLEVPRGEIGEFWVRGANVMQGYWDDLEATAGTFSGGWLKTGDLGYMNPQGYIFIVDRAKDMVISAGENIYCAEVEHVLGQVEHHLEVALFGFPDERLGERAIAAVVPRPGAGVTEEGVKAHVASKLADYKVPAEVLLDLGPLPRNALGKVDKAALKERYLERQKAAGSAR